MSDLVGFEPPKMDWTTGPDLITRFKRFRQKCELLFEGPLKSRAPEQKCSYLLLWAGDYGLDLFNTWNLTTDQKKNISEYWKRFEEHVQPQANKILNRYYLRNLKQNGRPLDAFLTEARLLIQNCGYPDEMQDEIMRDTLVFGTDHEAVRKKCITKGNDLTYEKARDIARTEEATQAQLRAMDAPVPPTQVDSLGARQKNPIKSDMPPKRPPRDSTRCQRCGNNQHPRGQRCPASGVECFNCHNRGHFGKMCKIRKANVHEVQGGHHNQGEQGSEDPVNFPIDDATHGFFLGALSAEQPKSTPTAEQIGRSKVMTKIQLTAEPFHKPTITIVCKVDTGAEVNVISEVDYNQIFPNPAARSLRPAQLLTAYGGHQIKTLGSRQLYVHHNGNIRKATFTVTNAPGPAILGCKTCEELGLIKVNCSLVSSDEEQVHTPLTKKNLTSDFPDCFEGLGTFNMKPYHIVLDPKAEPVVHAPRAVPVHLHKMFKDELDQMVELGVIVPVKEPTEWVNSIVLSKTTNDDGIVTKLRVCLDPRDLNKWVKREHYYTKTVDEVVAQLHDAKFFSIIDAKKGYWHVPLDEQSSLLTTFNSPFGRYRFTRLPFGLIVSQDVFQKELDTALEGLPGVTGIADDNFVYGSTEKEHDENLLRLMERAREKGIKFNANKLQLKCDEANFFGHTWTSEGVKPDNKKVSAILAMKPPDNAKDLQSFLGLVNYLARYSSQLSTITAPLRELTKKEIAFVWGPEHDYAFQAVKQEISSMGVLRYFNPKADTTIQTDASQKGLGAVLLQHGQPICYASRALTETEQNYSNIERETLGVVWGLEKFNYFIYGKHCTLHTDHKPLESIFKKKLVNCPPRLQRLLIRALKYDVTVKYVKGSEVPIADALSRVTPQPCTKADQSRQIHVHHITRTLPASPIKLQQIREETAKDNTLALLRDTIYEGWPSSRSECLLPLSDFWNFREDLTIEDGIVLKCDRIVVPPTLRPDILKTIHQGHLGVEKCLLRARSTVYWPGITSDITQLVSQCEACQKHQKRTQKEPLLQPEPPCRPWERLSSDLFEHRGQQYLLLSDHYSKFPIIRKLTGTSSLAIVNHMKSIFSEHGIPSQLITDNGPQYDSREFRQFTESYGIEHITSSPLYPQSNGFAERTVQTVKNTLRKCEEEGEDPYLGILSYRTTPVDHQLKSPAELLNNRKFRTTLPTAKRALLTGIDRDHVKESLYQRQKQQAQYYNRSAGPPLPPLHDGQHIRLYDRHTKTWQPGTVKGQTCAPRSYTVESSTSGALYRRTRTQLKPDTAFSDHTSTQGLPVNHPMPCDQERGQPVEPTDDVAVTRCSPAPVTRPPEPTTMTTTGHEHGYVTRSGRVVKLNIKPSM